MGNPGKGSTSKLQWGNAMNWIASRSVDSARRTESFDPATSQPVSTCADANLADAQSAVAAASVAVAVAG